MTTQNLQQKLASLKKSCAEAHTAETSVYDTYQPGNHDQEQPSTECNMVEVDLPPSLHPQADNLETANQVLETYLLEVKQHQTWYFDSGATTHLAGTAESFSELKTSPSTREVPLVQNPPCGHVTTYKNTRELPKITLS
jgi:hypothetical protein